MYNLENVGSEFEISELLPISVELSLRACIFAKNQRVGIDIFLNCV